MTASRSVFWLRVLVWCFAIPMLLSCSGRADSTVDASFIHIPGAEGAERAPKMRWTSTRMDLGLVAAGETRTLIYTVTNGGKSPMVITQVMPSCGCTIAQAWNTSPLSPGDSMDVVLEFVSGDQTRSVEEFATVVTNAIPASVELTFTAQVIGPEPTSTPSQP